MSAQAAAMPVGRVLRMRAVVIIPLLIFLLAGAAIVAAGIGAAGIPLARLPAALGLGAGDPAFVARDQLVLWSIRLPRIALAGIVGALLAASGTIMQGLFRNPLADPALVGVLSGGALAAAGTIVVGDRLLAGSGLALPSDQAQKDACGG